MIRRTPMGDIRSPSNSSSGGKETGACTQCVNGREPQIHELRCHGIDWIYREVHTYALIEIPTVTVGEFVTEYISENGRRNQIIG